MKKSTWVRNVVIAAAVAAAVLAFLPLRPYASEILRRYFLPFLEWVEGMGAWGPALLGAAYVVACILLLPGSIFTLASGFLFGVFLGSVVSSLASVAGAAIAFFISRTLARGWIEARAHRNPRFRAIDAAVAKRGFKIVVLTRLSPVFPFNFLNYALGVTRVSFRDYIIASWVGMLPGTILYVYVGSALKSLAEIFSDGGKESTTAEKWIFRIGLVVTVALTIYMTQLAKKALAREVPEKKGEG